MNEVKDLRQHLITAMRLIKHVEGCTVEPCTCGLEPLVDALVKNEKLIPCKICQKHEATYVAINTLVCRECYDIYAAKAIIGATVIVVKELPMQKLLVGAKGVINKLTPGESFMVKYEDGRTIMHYWWHLTSNTFLSVSA